MRFENRVIGRPWRKSRWSVKCLGMPLVVVVLVLILMLLMLILMLLVLFVVVISEFWRVASSLWSGEEGRNCSLLWSGEVTEPDWRKLSLPVSEDTARPVRSVQPFPHLPPLPSHTTFHSAQSSLGINTIQLVSIGFRLKICFRMLESKNKKYHSIRIEVSLDEIVFTLNR